MIVSHILKWIDTARVSERAAAASALARAYINSDLPFEDRCAAEAALTLLLDDVSAKVRQSLAEALSMSHHAPPQVIAALASDQPEVAALVLALMGAARADRVMRDACVKASVTLIEGTRAEEHAALIEHLRLRGDLTASFIIRTVAHGKVDFFGSALVALAQQSEQRVR